MGAWSGYGRFDGADYGWVELAGAPSVSPAVAKQHRGQERCDACPVRKMSEHDLMVMMGLPKCPAEKGKGCPR